MYYSCTNEEEKKERKKEYQSTLSKRTGVYLKILKVVGDIIPAGHGSEVFSTYLGLNFTDSACGLGGLVSALISSYELYE